MEKGQKAFVVKKKKKKEKEKEKEKVEVEVERRKVKEDDVQSVASFGRELLR